MGYRIKALDEYTLTSSSEHKTPRLRVSLVRRAKNTARLLLDGTVRSLNAVLPFVDGKKGLEIGGPSGAFQRWLTPVPVYHRVGSLDNCDFSSVTTWTKHADDYRFHPHKPSGKNIFCNPPNFPSIPST